MKIDICCKVDDSPWYSATSAFSLCDSNGLRPCAAREMFEYLMTTHRAGDLCTRCREIITAFNKQEST